MKVLTPVKIFHIQDMLNETEQYRDTTDGLLLQKTPLFYPTPSPWPMRPFSDVQDNKIPFAVCIILPPTAHQRNFLPAFFLDCLKFFNQ